MGSFVDELGDLCDGDCDSCTSLACETSDEDETAFIEC